MHDGTERKDADIDPTGVVNEGFGIRTDEVRRFQEGFVQGDEFCFLERIRSVVDATEVETGASIGI